MVRRKSLLIGINYTGQQAALQGCQQDVQNMYNFLQSRGYPTDPGSMVVLTDARTGPYYPSARNILAAMDWLVRDPECCLFLHYSGHGSQVADPDGDRESGFDDTIVPVDYQQHGQLDSDLLHRHLVSALPRNSTLFVIFDCCHSGSALELPFVYRTDKYGNISLMDDFKQGIALYNEARHLLHGGFSYDRATDARHLLGGATDFFKGLQHQFLGDDDNNNNDAPESGLDEEKFMEDWAHEGKSVFMFSGCRDDQTSADANIGGSHVGAMSWAFLETMRQVGGDPRTSYVEILQSTRNLLAHRYSQVPQLSVGYKFDLNRPLKI